MIHFLKLSILLLLSSTYLPTSLCSESYTISTDGVAAIAVGKSDEGDAVLSSLRRSYVCNSLQGPFCQTINAIPQPYTGANGNHERLQHMTDFIIRQTFKKTANQGEPSHTPSTGENTQQAASSVEGLNLFDLLSSDEMSVETVIIDEEFDDPTDLKAIFQVLAQHARFKQQQEQAQAQAANSNPDVVAPASSVDAPSANKAAEIQAILSLLKGHAASNEEDSEAHTPVAFTVGPHGQTKTLTQQQIKEILRQADEAEQKAKKLRQP